MLFLQSFVNPGPLFVAGTSVPFCAPFPSAKAGTNATAARARPNSKAMDRFTSTPSPRLTPSDPDVGRNVPTCNRWNTIRLPAVTRPLNTLNGQDLTAEQPRHGDPRRIYAEPFSLRAKAYRWAPRSDRHRRAERAC